ncbi:MAG: L-aspartate oxidase [bacterium]|nr:L-aspartate oxidase [bacterium]
MGTLLDTRRHLTDFETSRVGHLLTDVLVVGTGVAGARAAIEAARHGEVIAVAKAAADESNTRMAQGGIAAAMGPDDSPDRHRDDTLRVGCGLGSPAAVDRLVRDGPKRIDELIRFGAVFDLVDGQPARTREGGHSVFRVLHADGDRTGREIARALLVKLRSEPRVRVFENCFLIDLLTTDGRCVGAITFHPQYGHQMIWARQTILAGGGCGRVYRESTNPAVATGDVMAAAYRGGAALADMEMMQFHPTTLYIAGSSRALISEAVRGEGAHLVDRHGHRFMLNRHRDHELAPRDVVSRAIRQQILEVGGPCVYLDVRHLEAAAFAERFPGITRQCAEFGIDVARDLIPVSPGAHYMIGGVVVDLAGRTNLAGLLACGEAACTGVHGANRLASNSLLEGLVFGAIAGTTAGQALADTERVGPALGLENHNPASPRTALDLVDVRNSLRSIMWRNVGIVRTADRLAETVEITEFWGRFVMDKIFNDTEGWETQNMLTLSRLMALAAGRRTESRGVHFRTDVPPGESAATGRHWLCQRSELGPRFAEASVDWQPVGDDRS